MRHHLPLALLALAGCCPRTPLTPNGSRHVLSYRTEFPALADGLEDEVVLPSAISEGGGKLDPCPRRTLAWDFAGTRIEATNGRTLEVLSAAESKDGYAVRVRCNSGAGGAIDGIAVRVLAGSEARYEDLFPLLCAKPEQASFEVLPAGSPEVFLVGARFALEPRLLSARGERLWGTGCRADDAGVLRLEEERERRYLVATALQPGQRPTLHAGTTLVEAPVEIVGADAIARIDFTVTPLNPGDPSRTVLATPKDARGRAIGVATDACTWTGKGGAARFVPSSSPFCQTYVEPGAGVKEVCVRLAGKSACTAL